MTTWIMYHGGRSWTGVPSVQPPKRGRAEHGPGIYLTTSHATAAKYAKGGGVVHQIDLSSDLTWIDDVVVPLADVERFVRAQKRMPKRKEILADVHRNAERMAPRLGTGLIQPATLLNLMVNYDATSGEAGLALADFLVAHGVDAALVHQSGEDWVVVFNPRKITAYEVVPAKGFKGPFDLPRVTRRR